jgi:hypothetical protein
MAWQKVVWGSFIRGTYSIKVNGVMGLPRRIAWHRYSVFPPWHTWGTFDSSQTFGATFVCDPYCDFWFDLNPGEYAGVSGNCTGCFPGASVPFG